MLAFWFLEVSFNVFIAIHAYSFIYLFILIFTAFKLFQGLSMRQIRFRFDGQPINETDTPAQVKIFVLARKIRVFVVLLTALLICELLDIEYSFYQSSELFTVWPKGNRKKNRNRLQKCQWFLNNCFITY